MWQKELFSSLAVILTLAAYFPYLGSILKGRTRPHFFSWLIWSLSTFIVFFAQVKAGGGVGAWPVAVSGSITLYIALLAFLKKGDINIRKLDYVFLAAAFLAIPLWFLTADPMWAVVLITIIDLCGFGPTVRKAFYFPEQENMQFYALFFIRCGFVLLALESYSLTTVLFPTSVGLSCLLMVFLLAYRRKL